MQNLWVMVKVYGRIGGRFGEKSPGWREIWQTDFLYRDNPSVLNGVSGSVKGKGKKGSG